MESYNKPYLEKYRGRASRHKCPACGDPLSFAYYLDGGTGEIINEAVGRCNHESGCGYHYTPKQYFEDNPHLKGRNSASTVVAPIRKRIEVPKNEPDYIPFRYVSRAASYNSCLIEFLCPLLDMETNGSPTIERMMQDYAIGASKNRGTVFWQIDITGKVRTGKIILYNQYTGHRSHEPGGVNWVHSILKKKGELKPDFNLKQCLFGEHLLKMYPDKPVAVVESEKSAVIASAVIDTHIWLATGGKSQFSDKMDVLKGRDITLFPDVDGYEEWIKKAAILRNEGFNVKVSDILEKYATAEERLSKIDIADWIVGQLQQKRKSGYNPSDQANREYESRTERFKVINPAFELLVNAFDLIPVG